MIGMNLSSLSLAEAQTATGSCGDPGVVLHAQKLDDSYAPGDKVRYKCQQGYQLVSGQLVVTCLSNSTWSGQLPECEATPTRTSTAFIGCIMGLFLVMVVILLPIDFCLFKRRKIKIAERRARRRGRPKGRPAPFLSSKTSSATQNTMQLTRWQDGRPVPPNGYLPNQLLPPSSGRHGLLEPLVKEDNETDNVKVGKKRSNVEHINKPRRLSYLRKKKRIAPSIESPRNYPDLPERPQSRSQGSRNDYDDNDDDDDVITGDSLPFSGYKAGNEIHNDTKYDTNYDPLEGSTSRYFQENEMTVMPHKKNKSSSSGRQEIYSTGDHKIHNLYNQYGHREQPSGGGAVLYGSSQYV